MPTAYSFSGLQTIMRCFLGCGVASRELDIVLTAREGGQHRIPMCGVPYHSANTYIKRLLDRGFRVAICDQVEDPRQAKGIVQREVTRVVTPGTALDETWLTEDNNFLAALVLNEETAGLAYVDLLTGEFGACQLSGTRVRAGLMDEGRPDQTDECLVTYVEQPGGSKPTWETSSLYL